MDGTLFSMDGYKHQGGAAAMDKVKGEGEGREVT